jgi:hypothetical protein
LVIVSRDEVEAGELQDGGLVERRLEVEVERLERVLGQVVTHASNLLASWGRSCSAP